MRALVPWNSALFSLFLGLFFRTSPVAQRGVGLKKLRQSRGRAHGLDAVVIHRLQWTQSFEFKTVFPILLLPRQGTNSEDSLLPRQPLGCLLEAEVVR